MAQEEDVQVASLMNDFLYSNKVEKTDESEPNDESWIVDSGASQCYLKTKDKLNQSNEHQN